MENSGMTVERKKANAIWIVKNLAAGISIRTIIRSQIKTLQWNVGRCFYERKFDESIVFLIKNRGEDEETVKLRKRHISDLTSFLELGETIMLRYADKTDEVVIGTNKLLNFVRVIFWMMDYRFGRKLEAALSNLQKATEKVEADLGANLPLKSKRLVPRRDEDGHLEAGVENKKKKL